LAHRVREQRVERAGLERGCHYRVEDGWGGNACGRPRLVVFGASVSPGGGTEKGMC
jgi:hypothetical protein